MGFMKHLPVLTILLKVECLLSKYRSFERNETQIIVRELKFSYKENPEHLAQSPLPRRHTRENWPNLLILWPENSGRGSLKYLGKYCHVFSPVQVVHKKSVDNSISLNTENRRVTKMFICNNPLLRPISIMTRTPRVMSTKSTQLRCERQGKFHTVFAS